MTYPVITYPCFVPAAKRGRGEAPHLLVIHGRPCLILLAEDALLAYVRQRYAGQPTVAAAANKFDGPQELLAYLKDVEALAARQGVFHVALNPSKARGDPAPMPKPNHGPAFVSSVLNVPSSPKGVP
jgi:hypothetical protein